VKAIVSACLLGIHCRYDGSTKGPIKVPEELCLVPVCPEQLGGLPTPRAKAHLEGGDGEAVWKGRARVVDEAGNDLTQFFLRGAREVLGLCGILGVKVAILKEKSPSCGVRKVWIGEELSWGKGVLTALLEAHGVRVISSEEFGDGP